MAVVLGVDGHRRGWVSVRLDAGEVTAVHSDAALTGILAAAPDAAVVAIDIPLGLPADTTRVCDVEARALLRGVRPSSVFATPPRVVLEAPDYTTARAIAARHWSRGVSAQAYNLGPRILEADAIAEADSRLIEAHPELSFAEMAGAPVAEHKKSWDGLHQRLLLLRRHGIELPQVLGPGAGGVPADDIVDAAAAAWTAERHRMGEAVPVPDPPEAADGRRMAIWR